MGYADAVYLPYDAQIVFDGMDKTPVAMTLGRAPFRAVDLTALGGPVPGPDPDPEPIEVHSIWVQVATPGGEIDVDGPNVITWTADTPPALPEDETILLVHDSGNVQLMYAGLYVVLGLDEKTWMLERATGWQEGDQFSPTTFTASHPPAGAPTTLTLTNAGEIGVDQMVF